MDTYIFHMEIYYIRFHTNRYPINMGIRKQSYLLCDSDKFHT
jgi:hypothetical protein